MKTDVLVIGSGISGLYFALKCAQFAKVTLATKDRLENSNTSKAQGGIAAALDSNDSPDAHFLDTIKAGDGLCNEEAVKFMVAQAPDCINELQAMGVPFNLDAAGKYDLALEGGHSAARVTHVLDITGAGVVKTLIRRVKEQPNITVLEDYFAIDLCVNNNRCEGAWFIDEDNQEIQLIQSGVTFLATGGAGRIYRQNTNPEGATADGFAMAWRAGARLQNMEFVQFHPTMLYLRNGEDFLISEAVRGFGAELVSCGKPFMHRYHRMGSLAPRDIVTRAILDQMRKDGSPCVYLDTSRLDSKALKERFPGIYLKCLHLGIDITKQPIPVVPAAHYMCGGVATNLDGETDVTGLYVCGETACTGVHGANRLASNSLLEGVVFARAAAKHVKENLNRFNTSFDLPESYPLALNSTEIPFVEEIRNRVASLMWEKAGIVRTGEQLKNALSQLEYWEEEIAGMGMMSGINRNLMEALNIVQVSKLVVSSALWRKETRGVHYRADFPLHDNAFLHYSEERKPVHQF